MAIEQSHYQITEFIGDGSQGSVFSAVHLISKQKVAIKIYESSDLSCFREVRILKQIQKLQLQHSLQFIESFLQKGKLLVVTEFVEGEELHDCLLGDRISTFQDLKTIFKNILLAVHELHENNICHLDLKLENIMIDTKSGEIKLLDFGFADTTFAEGKERMITKFRGSIHYSSPEIVTNTPFDGKKADIWSLGVLFYVLIARHFPFQGTDPEHANERMNINSIARQIVTNELLFTDAFTCQTRQLVISMMHPDPQTRPTARKLLQMLRNL